MKNYIIILMVVILTCCAHLQNTVTKTNSYDERGYIAALRSDNEGLVESAIFQLVFQQMNGLNRINNNILSEFESLKHNTKSENIRRISGLAIKFYKEFNWELQTEARIRFLNQERCFNIISDLLHEKNKDLTIDFMVVE